MTWFALILTMMLTVVPKWLSEWAFQLCVLVSLGANVVLGLLSRTRSRSASGWWAQKEQMVLVSILWFLYQLGEEATKSAIGKLALSGSDASEDEKQVVALWAPFLLLHLGGPDNLTAYALEDNKLEKRAWFDMITNVFGVGSAIYNYTYRDDRSWVMVAASLMIFIAGVIKYWERAYARWKANLEKMQEDASSSSSDDSSNKETSGCRSTDEARMLDQLRCRIESKKGRKNLCDREALLLAQDLFPVWRHAMVDSSVMPRSSRQLASEQILWLEWRSMCKVAEMELSLMYEVLYTKAIVAHNWSGFYYLIRFLSPLCTAAATLLFWFHRQQQGGGAHRIRGSFVGITYALLVVNFLLDLAWLLRALGSTWAYAYLQTQAPAWLRHQVACPGRWCCIHRFVIHVDPMWLLRCRDPVSYRTWSGTIGRYNLLREAITPTTTCCSLCPDWLQPKEETRYLNNQLCVDVKKLLFKRVKEILLEAICRSKKDGNHYEDDSYSDKCYYYIMKDVRTKWGHKALDLRNRKRLCSIKKNEDDDGKWLFPGLDDIHNYKEAPKFGTEFEEDVLAWHIATCILLPYIRQQGVPAGSVAHAKAIAVMSEYMMFLVAVRREMLPGLVLHSMLEETKKTLANIWCESGNKKNMAEVCNQDMLAKILRRMRVATPKKKGKRMEGNEGTTLVWDAVNLFASLTLAGDTVEDRHNRNTAIDKGKREKRSTPVPVPELLELVFNVWVDKLVYAAVRCSRESHAKQLSAGGDLTTVLWMVIQHAGPFRMGELKAIYIPRMPSLASDELPPSDYWQYADVDVELLVPSVDKLPPSLPSDELPPSDFWLPADEEEDYDDLDTQEYNTKIKYFTL